MLSHARFLPSPALTDMDTATARFALIDCHHLNHHHHHRFHRHFSLNATTTTTTTTSSSSSSLDIAGLMEARHLMTAQDVLQKLAFAIMMMMMMMMMMNQNNSSITRNSCLDVAVLIQSSSSFCRSSSSSPPSSPVTMQEIERLLMALVAQGSVRSTTVECDGEDGV